MFLSYLGRLNIINLDC